MPYGNVKAADSKSMLHTRRCEKSSQKAALETLHQLHKKAAWPPLDVESSWPLSAVDKGGEKEISMNREPPINSSIKKQDSAVKVA